MKIKYVMIIIVIIVIGVCCYLILNKNRIRNYNLDGSNIKSFYISYSNGYMMNAYTRYQLALESDKYIAKIKPYGVAEEDILEIEVEKELMENISEVLKKYEVNKWNGFNKTDKGVLDGDSFSFSVTLINDQSIEASGYMRWPEHYRDVVNEISPLFMSIYNKEKGIKENE